MVVLLNDSFKGKLAAARMAHKLPIKEYDHRYSRKYTVREKKR